MTVSRHQSSQTSLHENSLFRFNPTHKTPEIPGHACMGTKRYNVEPPLSVEQTPWMSIQKSRQCNCQSEIKSNATILLEGCLEGNTKLLTHNVFVKIVR